MDNKIIKAIAQLIFLYVMIEAVDFVDRKYMHLDLFEWDGKKTLNFMLLFLILIKLYLIPNELKKLDQK